MLQTDTIPAPSRWHGAEAQMADRSQSSIRMRRASIVQILCDGTNVKHGIHVGPRLALVGTASFPLGSLVAVLVMLSGAVRVAVGRVVPLARGRKLLAATLRRLRQDCA